MQEDLGRFCGVSLFSGAGIGDLGLRAAGVSLLALAEIDAERASLARANFPLSKVLAIDLEEGADALCSHVEGILKPTGRELDVISCTPPCQGMSKAGMGKILQGVRDGKRPMLDPRNRLILSGISVIERLRPRWVIFENVVEMRNTVIEDHHGVIRPILEIISSELSEYQGFAHCVEFADYGIPQRRKRLITVLTRDADCALRLRQLGGAVPAPTHSESGVNGLPRWVNVEEALADFPSLDARDAKSASDPELPFHRVPVLESRKYHWISNTPEGRSAFDNQCIAEGCLSQSNPTHRSSREKGINRSRTDTPIHCVRCGALLPRPTKIEANGDIRLMSGFTSSYRRMRKDLPSPTLTRNFSYPCSDNKVHPTENRVLSLAEAFVLQTLADFPFEWIRDDGGKVTDSMIRLVLAESVPPRFMMTLFRYLHEVDSGAQAGSAALGGQEVGPFEPLTLPLEFS